MRMPFRRFVFFFQAEDGIRDGRVTGVQTCALPICVGPARAAVLSSFEVVVTMALSITLLGERLGPRQWLGAALILGAVVLQNLGALRPFARGQWRRQDE